MLFDLYNNCEMWEVIQIFVLIIIIINQSINLLSLLFLLLLSLYQICSVVLSYYNIYFLQHSTYPKWNLFLASKPPYGRSEYQDICGQGRIQVSSTSLSGRCFIKLTFIPLRLNLLLRVMYCPNIVLLVIFLSSSGRHPIPVGLPERQPLSVVFLYNC